MYRVPFSSNIGVYTSVSQYNEINGVIQTSTEHRKSVLIDIINYVQNQEDINDVLLVGDLNQPIYKERIQYLFREIGVKGRNFIQIRIPPK